MVLHHDLHSATLTCTRYYYCLRSLSYRRTIYWVISLAVTCIEIIRLYDSMRWKECLKSIGMIRKKKTNSTYEGFHVRICHSIDISSYFTIPRCAVRTSIPLLMRKSCCKHFKHLNNLWFIIVASKFGLIYRLLSKFQYLRYVLTYSEKIYY